MDAISAERREFALPQMDKRKIPRRVVKLRSQCPTCGRTVELIDGYHRNVMTCPCGAILQLVGVE